MGACASAHKRHKIHIDPNETQSSFTSALPNHLTFTLESLDPSSARPTLVSPEQSCRDICKNSLKLVGFSHDQMTKKCIVSQSNTGFLTVLNFAYTNHYHLQLSVSDFLLLITQGLALHLKKRAEMIEKEFLTPKAKKLLRVKEASKTFSSKTSNELFENLSTQIRSRYKEPIFDIINDDTSVSTGATKLASQISMLNQLEEVEGQNDRISTGLPKITLEGSPEDWEKLRAKVHKLKEINELDKLLLDWWLKYLIPVVEKLCDQAINKQADLNFWTRFYIVHGNIKLPYIQGWINVFFPYVTAHGDLHVNESVDWESRLGEDYFGVTIAQVPSGLSAVALQREDAGKVEELLMVSGLLGPKVTGGNKVRAEHFWAIFAADDGIKK